MHLYYICNKLGLIRLQDSELHILYISCINYMYNIQTSIYTVLYYLTHCLRSHLLAYYVICICFAIIDSLHNLWTKETR